MSYQAPLRDMRFVLHELFDAAGHCERLGNGLDRELIDGVLEEAAAFAAGEVAPLNRNSDEEGCYLENGQVSTPKGFAEAYRQYVDNGWASMTGPVEYGGQGFPQLVAFAFHEMLMGASLSFRVYSGLTEGAVLALYKHGSETLKQQYLGKLVSGQWTGTMCLTEPQAGTDLALLRTRAEPQADGSYRVSGSKIFISGGEQDISENIIHLVLARLPDAPAGVKGISLLLVPKFIAAADGTPGGRNTLSCGAIEHKMGIKGASTCVMNFDGATGWLVGEANQGLACMFTMMNDARFQVGLQGLGIGEAAFQGALRYARERLQSRGLAGVQAADKAADPIIVHPDVRRMLLTMKALNEGGRAFSSYVALQLDIAKFSDDDEARLRAEAQVALLTPVAKAFLTDMGLETTVHGQQIFGGHGFIREWGQEQLVRDCRITQIYEGTNGIQALDLVGRKIVGSGGTMYQAFVDEIRTFIADAGPELAEFAEPLKAAMDNLDELTAWVIDQAKVNPNEIGAASVEYLHVFGYTAYAYMWARMAVAAFAKQDEGDFYQSKLGTARFYFARLLPRIHSLSASVKAGSESLYLLDAAQF
ncbi:MAG: acyl-CoA dehydrogenase [Pseudomonas sp.]|nr:acyl-CoA dehydrogenase [Pseudomonas sp.]